MKKICVSIHLGRASIYSLHRNEVIADMLKELAYNIKQGYKPELLRDPNGNTVGTVSYD